jgi:tetratricopeptide (TPR) repeat protein
MIREKTRKAKLTQAIVLAAALGLLGPTAAVATDAESANAFFQAQQWDQSAESYRALTAEDPSNASYWFRLGQSLLSLGQHAEAIPALQSAVDKADPNTPVAIALLSIARSHAALANKDQAIASLEAIVATGVKPFNRVNNSPEFSAISNSPEFLAVLEQLKPCGSDEHRAFDLWIGEWEVTTPAREGWTATSSITVANNGCSIHEDYLTQGGYSGRSINFYDPQKKMWHQTWIDNQGAPLYLEGGLVDGAMVLTDATSRVTWSTLPDGQVRQHWESTSDGGKTYTTAFDGYYRRK